MFGNDYEIDVECKYGECCSVDDYDSGCDKCDGYKDCGVYKMMVENKAEYDKMGVVERFGFIAMLSEEGS